MVKEKTDIVLFETSDKSISMPVEVKGETVWLSANQMALLFERDEKTIRKHIWTLWTTIQIRIVTKISFR